METFYDHIINEVGQNVNHIDEVGQNVSVYRLGGYASDRISWISSSRGLTPSAAASTSPTAAPAAAARLRS